MVEVEWVINDDSHVRAVVGWRYIQSRITERMIERERVRERLGSDRGTE